MLLFKCNIFLKFLFLVLIGLVSAEVKISDKRLCVDDKCEVPISEGKTLLRYISPNKNILSFGSNEKVTIFSKSAGSNPTLWGVEINGRRGYIPHEYIKEMKPFRTAEKLVDTEFVSNSPTIEVPSEGPKPTESVVNVNPEPVKKPYEIIDGTKVPIDVDAHSEESSSGKSNESSSNFVATDNKKQSDEKELKNSNHDSKPNGGKDTNEILSDIITNTVNFLTNGDDKIKRPLDITINKREKYEEEQEDEEEEEDDDDDDDDDDSDDENKDGVSEEDDDEEIENKEKNKREDSVSNESSKAKLQFRKDSLKTKNNKAENLEKNFTQKTNTEDTNDSTLETNKGESKQFSDNLTNNFTRSNGKALDSENQALPKETKDNKNKGKSLNIASPENIKEQHENKTKQQAESILNTNSAKIDVLQQSTNDLEEISEVEANKNSKAKLESNIERNPLQFNQESLETKSNKIKNLEKVMPQKNNTKQMTNSTLDKNERKSRDFSGNLSNTNYFTDQKLNKVGEITVKNTIKSDINQVNKEDLKSSNQKLPLKLQTDENFVKQTPFFENYSKNEAIELEYNNSAQETIELKNNLQDNVKNETSDLSEIQKDGGKSYELKENQENKILINTNTNKEIPNISETSTQNIQDNLTHSISEDSTQNVETSTETIQDSLTQNIPEDLTKNIQEDLAQNSNEESADEMRTTDNNKNNYLNVANDGLLISQSSNLNTDSLKSESNSIPGSFSIQYDDDKQDENENLNHKTSDEVYQIFHDKSSLLFHKNRDNELSESEPHAASETEQGNEYCLKSENPEDCALGTRDSNSGNDFFQETIMEFLLNLPNDVVSTVLITALTTILFLLGYIYIDKSNRIRPLIAKINKLEKALLLAEEENKIAKDKLLQELNNKVNDNISSDALDSLQQKLEDALNAKTSLEEQIVNLEKELENSTEVGLELNRMLSDFLSSQDSDVLVANIEQLQRQLVEQQGTINSYSETLNVKETEIHELRLELEISNSKLTELQKENERATANLLKIEEEKYELQNKLESEVNALKRHIEQLTISSTAQINKLSDELKIVQKKAEESQRNAELKTKEYSLLKENTLKLKTLKDEDISSLLDVATFKAELELLSKEKHLLLEHCKQSDEVKDSIEKQYQKVVNEMQTLQRRYDEADREKLEAQTKLEVLENYFKERETNLQKELAKHEAMFMEKQGETYSITEKIKFMQEELQNYKAQNESLKQEIMEQEVQMKSQISLLEKRVHENWVNARQAERKLEEAKQEAAQLRNRLTIRERTLQEEKYQNRLKSPPEQNGELPVSPTPASPPLIFGARDLTTSPPLQGLPPPFLPPPPFMPPPIPGGVPPPFMPPPSMPPLQAMFPSDRRPAPLGRMSSPPIDSRYSPDSRAYSPYSRNSPSPTSDDDYCHSPPPLHRGYSPINNRESKREYRRSPGASKVSRNHKGSMHSSGSANSNESLEKIPRKPSKV